MMAVKDLNLVKSVKEVPAKSLRATITGIDREEEKTPKRASLLRDETEAVTIATRRSIGNIVDGCAQKSVVEAVDRNIAEAKLEILTL